MPESAPERKEHEPTTASDLETTGNPYHLSERMRRFVGAVALILVFSMTALFVLRIVHW
jgi:hypothetical protein